MGPGPRGMLKGLRKQEGRSALNTSLTCHIFIAAIVFLVVMYILRRMAGNSRAKPYARPDWKAKSPCLTTVVLLT